MAPKKPSQQAAEEPRKPGQQFSDAEARARWRPGPGAKRAACELSDAGEPSAARASMASAKAHAAFPGALLGLSAKALCATAAPNARASSRCTRGLVAAERTLSSRAASSVGSAKRGAASGRCARHSSSRAVGQATSKCSDRSNSTKASRALRLHKQDTATPSWARLARAMAASACRNGRSVRPAMSRRGSIALPTLLAFRTSLTPCATCSSVLAALLATRWSPMGKVHWRCLLARWYATLKARQSPLRRWNSTAWCPGWLSW
mmetsp:Transcript_65156/g.210076  ORF Transcript_65156/g.210076 Transcript_65156/m.210076 type:complete len:263 (-) Transcript_65156:330-1118(-)